MFIKYSWRMYKLFFPLKVKKKKEKNTIDGV